MKWEYRGFYSSGVSTLPSGCPVAPCRHDRNGLVLGVDPSPRSGRNRLSCPWSNRNRTSSRGSSNPLYHSFSVGRSRN